MNELKMKRTYLREENRKYGPTLVEVPRESWSLEARSNQRGPVRVWRSRDFLAQLYVEPGTTERNPVQRLTLCRSAIDSSGGWKDGLSWDEMQRLKNEAGFEGRWAVECFPPVDQVINVANLRHLWLLDNPPGAFGWLK